MATSTISTDTELSAVNSILGSIGQSPVTAISSTNPEISYIYDIFEEVTKDVQNEGWHFNTEYHVKVSPDSNGHITLPTNALSYDINDGHRDRSKDVVVRNGRLYDIVNHTDEFTEDLYLDIVTLYTFTDLPNAFQRYITHRASVRAAIQLVSNPELVKTLQRQEAQSRATCIEYECDKGDHSYLGLPHESVYQSYQPYNALRR